MAERLLCFYNDEVKQDQELRWVKQVRKVVKAIAFMDKGKLTSPKFGEILPLIKLSQHLKNIFVSLQICITLFLLARWRIMRVNNERLE
jgi:hypothetical protein